MINFTSLNEGEKAFVFQLIEQEQLSAEDIKALLDRGIWIGGACCITFEDVRKWLEFIKHTHFATTKRQ